MSNINDYKNIGIPEGYTKIKMYDEKTKKDFFDFINITFQRLFLTLTEDRSSAGLPGWKTGCPADSAAIRFR